MQELVTVDNILIRNILKCSSYTSVPRSRHFALPIIDKQKLLICLHYLLQQDHASLLRKCFEAQVKDTLPGDLVEQLRSDLSDLEINLTFSDLESLSKSSYKRLINVSSMVLII